MMQRRNAAKAAGGAAVSSSVASLVVRGVTVTYPSGKTALQDASFELGGGTI